VEIFFGEKKCPTAFRKTVSYRVYDLYDMAKIKMAF